MDNCRPPYVQINYSRSNTKPNTVEPNLVNPSGLHLWCNLLQTHNEHPAKFAHSLGISNYHLHLGCSKWGCDLGHIALSPHRSWEQYLWSWPCSNKKRIWRLKSSHAAGCKMWSLGGSPPVWAWESLSELRKRKNLQVPLLDQSTWAKMQPCEPVLVADEACVPKAYQTLHKNKKGIEGKDLKTTVEFRMLQALV